MKKYFYLGLFALLLFEIANVYFIMPMPGSQRFEIVGFAYFLYKWRWAIRALFALLMLLGIKQAITSKGKIIAGVLLLIAGFLIYFMNAKMSADAMFLKIKNKKFATASSNKIPLDKQVLGIINNGDIVAYPVQILAYHHQVEDVVGGEAILATYCSVCHSGRVYSANISGKTESFRLVGMDLFNAMFEDNNTGSWWRQATGECVAGPLKGKSLSALRSQQMALKDWLIKYPNSRILQYDPEFEKVYASLINYEKGLSKGSLTRTDTQSWKPKSRVIGVQFNAISKAYDWNLLVQKRILFDTCENTKFILIARKDNLGFLGYYVHHLGTEIEVLGDTIYANKIPSHTIFGKPIKPNGVWLTPLNAHQEYWHSWKTFHPNTLQYNP